MDLTEGHPDVEIEENLKINYGYYDVTIDNFDQFRKTSDRWRIHSTFQHSGYTWTLKTLIASNTVQVSIKPLDASPTRPFVYHYQFRSHSNELALNDNSLNLIEYPFEVSNESISNNKLKFSIFFHRVIQHI